MRDSLKFTPISPIRDIYNVEHDMLTGPCACGAWHNGNIPHTAQGRLAMIRDSGDFVIKDSGRREEYSSGMVRDTQSGKIRFDLVYWPMLRRWAAHMTKGMEKYGENNWQKANSLDEARRFRASLLRHVDQYLAGDRSEDHASAIIFNLGALEYLRDEHKVFLPPL